MIFILGANITKYRSKIEGLHTQKNLKNNQYPKILDNAIFELGGMKFDKEYYNLQKKCCEKEKKNKKSNGDDNDVDLVNMTFAQLEGKCYCCGKGGH